MPRLTLTQWLLVAVFLTLYGAVIFAITRAYYLDQALSRPVRSQAPPSQLERPASGLGATMQRFGAVSVVPDEVRTTDDPVLLARLGDQLFEQRAFSRAVAAYERALRFAPDDVDSYNDLGLSLYYLGRSERAVEILRQGIAVDPGYQRIQLTMGFVQRQRGNLDAAAQALQRAVELGPDTNVGAEAQRMLSQLP